MSPSPQEQRWAFTFIGLQASVALIKAVNLKANTNQLECDIFHLVKVRMDDYREAAYKDDKELMLRAATRVNDILDPACDIVNELLHDANIQFPNSVQCPHLC